MKSNFHLTKPHFLENIAKFTYGPEHPMKPKRIALTHELITGYELLRYMDIYVFFLRNKTS